MYIVKKIKDDVEYLPFFEDTDIFNDYNEFCPNKRVKLIADLYMAVMERENYFQYHTQTMYGNPDYDYRAGVVDGILKAGNIEEIKTETKFIYKKSGRKILVVDKLKRPLGYYESKKENDELRKIFGI